jgi:hypothetical protein
MAQYTKSVPKDPASSDKTLNAVLDVIIFQTKDGDEFISYENRADKVMLKFDGGDD